MSDGTLARLPQMSLPEGIPDPESPFVMVLLPYNRYLLGYSLKRALERWVWGRPGDEPREVFLYEDRELSLIAEGSTSTVLPPKLVSHLRSALLAQMDPPGEHLSSVLILRGLMRDHAAFAEGVSFRDEAAFSRFLDEDEVLRKGYWALRLALARGEFDIVVRLRAWLKAGPSVFSSQEAPARIWFSILDLPGNRDLLELEALSFSSEDLRHMVSQKTVPLLLFNPRSGYLVLSRFGARDRAPFNLWAFFPAALWGEIRERRKLTLKEVLLAVWGEYDASRALLERSRYAQGVGNGVPVT